MTRNQIEYWNYVENSRHNRAMEEETLRSNQAREKETGRSNVAKENETFRSNKANEALQSERNQLTREQNLINANYNNRSLSETERHNLRQEDYNQRYLDYQVENLGLGYAQMENARSIASINAGVGYAQVGATYATIAEQQRSNIARETENTRHNMQSEATSWKQVGVARTNASTQAKAQALENQKWNEDVSRATRAAQYNNIVSQTYLNQARQKLTSEQRKTEKYKQSNLTSQTVSNYSRIALDAARNVINGVIAVGGSK